MLEANVSDFLFPAEHDPKSVHKSEYFSVPPLVVVTQSDPVSFFISFIAKEEGDKLEDEGKDEPPSWAVPGKN